jgi:hypothetical protein
MMMMQNLEIMVGRLDEIAENFRILLDVAERMHCVCNKPHGTASYNKDGGGMYKSLDCPFHGKVKTYIKESANNDPH